MQSRGCWNPTIFGRQLSLQHDRNSTKNGHSHYDFLHLLHNASDLSSERITDAQEIKHLSPVQSPCTTPHNLDTDKSSWLLMHVLSCSEYMVYLIQSRIDKPYKRYIIGFIEKQLWFCQKLSNANNCNGLYFTDNKIINLDLKTNNG